MVTRFILGILLGTMLLQSSVAGVDRDMVPDAATAIKVGSAIIEGYMGKERFEAMVQRTPIRADLKGDYWVVYSFPRDEDLYAPAPEGTVRVVAGGGGPVVELSRHDAQVRDFYFQK